MSTELALLGGKPVRTKPFPTWPVFGEPEEQALLRTLRSGKWGKIDGEQVATFERRFADYCGVKHAIGVCNGTISLKIALLAADIRAGDEVIVPPYTFSATATSVIEANATPIFVDIDLETFNIDPVAVERAITPRTRAIIPVHLGGLPADMDAIMAIAKKHNLIVIEDAAHAHGSEYKKRRAGALGHMGSFSFQSSKNLTSGEGGLIVTDDDELAQRCRSIHNCGRFPGGQWYEHRVIAGNYRMGEFQGAILNAQLERFDEQTDRRDENARYLNEHLAKIPGIMPQKRTSDCTRNATHLYCYRFDPDAFGFSRARFVEALHKENIPATQGYTMPLYRQPLFVDKAFGPYTGCIDARPDLDYGKVRLPNCERLCDEQGGWLYQAVMLGTRQDMDDVVAAFQKIYDNRHKLAETATAVAAAR